MMKQLNLPEMELLLGRKIHQRKWEEIFRQIFRGKWDPTDIKKLLLLIAKKGEEASELRGILKTLRRLEPPSKINLPFLMDVCGTGGDGMKTFNISTISGLVIAGAGGYVAKHGNRAVSSRAGSSDLMEALGVQLDVPFSRMLMALNKFHFGYFHAPFYHPSFSKVQTIRRELGIRTLFNAIGPLVNPVELQYQMIGVSHPGWLRPLAETLTVLPQKRAAVFRSRGGMDELSTQEPNDILYIEASKIRKIRIDPRKWGFSRVGKGDYEGGDLKTNREIAVGILKNRIRGPKQDVVLLNSGFALWLSGLAVTVREGMERSRFAIRTGRALKVLEGLREYTNRRK